MRSVRVLAYLSIFILVTACSTKLSRFDVINMNGKVDTHQVTRSETADQGSGNTSSVLGPGGHTLIRTTLGGAYLRRTAVNSPTKKLSGGLFGNPRGIQ